MISLDQVQLLEHKVETAVAKIAELQKENDFLRSKFSELKVQYDELQKMDVERSSKLSLYEQNQPRIEEGIMKALERLNNVEDSVLRASAVTSEVPEQPQPVEQNQTVQNITPNPVVDAYSSAAPASMISSLNITSQSSISPAGKTDAQQMDIF